MSASPSLIPIPPRPPGEKRATIVPPRRSAKPWLIWLAAAGIVATAGVGWRMRVQPRASSRILVPTAKAFRGLLRATIRLSGNVAPTHFSDIFAPSVQAPDSGRGMVLIYLPPPGSMVERGQKIAEIDSQSVRDHLEDVQANVDQGAMDLRRLQARQAEETEAVRQRVREARGRLQQAQQDMRALAVRTRIDQEKLKLTLEEAEATYEEAERQVALTVERQEAATRLQVMSQEFQVRHLNRHKHDLAEFTIVAPASGQAAMKPIWRAGDRSMIQVGDLVSPAQPIMRIADLSSMELESSMNQAESEQVRIGQRATVRFDAYPDLEVPGRVEAIGSLASGGRRVNYYIRRVAVRISIEGSDPRMIVDSTASADVVVGEQEDSVIVPRQAVVETEGKTVVYVKQEAGFAPREVELGRSNNTVVAIVSGLQAGEEIALQPPD